MARSKKIKKRRRFTVEQRQSAVRYLREQRASGGRSCRSVAEEIGVSEALLWSWCKKYPDTSKPEFRAVEIVASQRSRLVIITPSGLRVEGVSIEEVAVLLKMLSS